MTKFVKQRERVLTLQCLVTAYVGANVFIGDDPKDWPYGIIDRHNQLEEVVRSRHRDEVLVSVVHRCAMDPIDGLYYCERELSFALSSQDEGDPRQDSPLAGNAAGGTDAQPPHADGVAGFNHSLQRLIAGAAP